MSDRKSGLSRPAQTFIVGTEAARHAFNPAFSGHFRATHSALTCDSAALPALRARPEWRWVLVVQNAAELQKMLTDLAAVSAAPDRLLVAAVAAEVWDVVAIRKLALQYAGPGVVVKGAEKGVGRALDVAERVLAVWSAAAKRDAEPEPSDLRRAWGDPAFKSGADVVIPPGWDSEGKIRAVADATGIDYDTAAPDQRVEGQPDAPVPMAALDGDEERERARDSKRKWVEEQEKWLAQFGQRLASAEQCAVPTAGNPSTDIEAVRAATSKQRMPQADFFQKLLSGSRR